MKIITHGIQPAPRAWRRQQRSNGNKSCIQSPAPFLTFYLEARQSPAGHGFRSGGMPLAFNRPWTHASPKADSNWIQLISNTTMSLHSSERFFILMRWTVGLLCLAIATIVVHPLCSAETGCDIKHIKLVPVLVGFAATILLASERLTRLRQDIKDVVPRVLWRRLFYELGICMFLGGMGWAVGSFCSTLLYDFI